MKNILSLALILSAIQGCALINPDDTNGEDGEIWCNTRYHSPGEDRVSAILGKEKGKAVRAASVKGYMYGVASALALQSNDRSSMAHWFAKPERLQIIDPKTEARGFDRTTFLLRPLADEKPVVIIAFSGSNDWKDWLGANTGLSREQYRQAREYTLQMLENEHVKDKDVVLVGTSLGGALALHTGWDKNIENRISAIWAFNPSPKLHGAMPNETAIQKTWVVYAEKEALQHLRNDWISKYRLEENQNIPLPLVKSNLWYAHYRWGAARQLLWIADNEMTQQNTQTQHWTEPLAILDKSRFATCDKVRRKIFVREGLQPTVAKPDSY